MNLDNLKLFSLIKMSSNKSYKVIFNADYSNIILSMTIEEIKEINNKDLNDTRNLLKEVEGLYNKYISECNKIINIDANDTDENKNKIISNFHKENNKINQAFSSYPKDLIKVKAAELIKNKIIPLRIITKYKDASNLADINSNVDLAIKGLKDKVIKDNLSL